ncbi:hypothetical protein Hanom_Chr09g00802311 [Helianthus anomalus]
MSPIGMVRIRHFEFVCWSQGMELAVEKFRFRAMGPISKEDMVIPHGATWYEGLMALPNWVFGEQVLAKIYQSAFPTFAPIMGTRPLCDGDRFWLEQIRPNFTYTRLDAFAVSLIATEGARVPNPRPCKAITFAGKEIVYLSSEESVDSSECKLSPSHNLFARCVAQFRC